MFRRYADIAPDAKAFVWGALYELTPACERALDAYEQVPAYYRKIMVTVETDAGPRQAMAYIMNPAEIAPPDIEYYGVVARGYGEWKLDATVLRRARYATIKR